MRSLRKYIGLVMVPMLILAGCSEETSSEEAQPQKDTKSQEESEPKTKAKTVGKVDVPEELEGLHILVGPGKYAGDKYDEEKVKAEIDKFPMGLSDEEYLVKLLKLVGEDYRPYIKLFNNFETEASGTSKQPGNVKKLPKLQEKEVNIVVLVDASGSMAGKVEGGVKMDLAKQAVKDFASQMPEGANVSLTAYGHKGSNQAKDKAESCKSIEEVYPLGAYDDGKFDKALDQFKPTGWTPLAGAMKKAKQQLEDESHAENIVYVVSDGIETCDGDPVQAAKDLHSSNIDAAVNIIGFDVKALKDAAEAGGGKYSSVDSKVDLEEHFEEEQSRLIDEWYKWERQNKNASRQTERQKKEALSDNEDEMKRLSEREEDRIKELSRYLEGRGLDSSIAIDIRSLTRSRAIDIRSYARSTGIDLRSQVRSNEIDKRSDIRREAIDERSDLRN